VFSPGTEKGNRRRRDGGKKRNGSRGLRPVNERVDGAPVSSSKGADSAGGGDQIRPRRMANLERYDFRGRKNWRRRKNAEELREKVPEKTSRPVKNGHGEAG